MTLLPISENALYQEFSQPQTAHNGWVSGTVWEVLYTANGGSTDFHHDEHGAFAFTPEIGSSSDGFWPPPSRIPGLTADAIPTYQMVSQWTGAWAEVKDLTWSEASGNGDAFLDPGETWQLQPVVRNSGSQTLLGNALLSSSDPFVTVTGGTVGLNVGMLAESALSPFTVAFSASAPAGTYTLDMQFDYEGYVDTAPVEIMLQAS